MVIVGALINGLLTVAGGTAGLLLRRFVSQSLGDLLMEALGLCVIFVAVQGMVGDVDALVVIVSIVVGTLVGTAADIDGQVQRLGDWVQGRLTRRFSRSAALGRFSEGFVSSTLFTCTGAMAIVGSIQSGLQLDHTTLIAKGVIDMVVVVVMAASLGVGVPFSGLCVFAYEGLLSLLVGLLSPVLTDVTVARMTVTGSLLLLAVGLNMLGVTGIKVANLVPAAFVPLLLVWWV